MRKFAVPFFLALFLLQAQTANRFALTIDNIMRGPGLVGYEPQQVRWSGDSQHIYFLWKQAAQKEDEPSDTYEVNRDGSGLRKLTDEEARMAPPVAGDTTRDNRLVTYVREGDIFVYDNTSAARRGRSPRPSEAETNPRFLADGKRIAFTRGGNLYVMSLESGMLVQMTDIHPAAAAPAASARRPGAAGAEAEDAADVEAAGEPRRTATGEPQRGTDSQEYLKKEQKELLEVVRERTARHDEEEARRKKENPRKPFTLQARQNVTGLLLSPDEKYVVASISENGNAKNTVIPNYITDSVYAEDINGRSNVGDTQNKSRLALIDVTTGEVKYVDHGQKAAAAAEGGASNGGAPPARNAGPPERDVALFPPVWSDDGSKAVLMARAADNKDRWILALDPATGQTRVLASDHDNAWVDGPGRQHARLDEERPRSLLPIRAHRLFAALRRGVRWRRAARADLRQLGSDQRRASRRTSRTSTSPAARRILTSSTSTRWAPTADR